MNTKFKGKHNEFKCILTLLIIALACLNSYTQVILQTDTIHLFDRFGNNYDFPVHQIEDIPAGKPLVAPPDMTCGYFKLSFADANTGFDDKTVVGAKTLGELRRDCLCQVYKDISAYIVPALNNCTGANGQVRIEVKESSSGTLGGSLAVASSYYLVADSNGFVPGPTYKVINSGYDPFYTYQATLQDHAFIQFNFGVYGNLLDPNYLSASLPSGSYDLYTIALHEVMHQLGFASFIRANGNGFGTILLPDRPVYTYYDKHLEDFAGNKLIVNTDGCYGEQFNSNSSTSFLSAPQCSTSGVYFGGDNVVNGVGFRPQTATSGTGDVSNSLSHFNKTCSGAPNYVMHFAVDTNEIKRVLTTAEMLVLCDLGYKTKNTFGNLTAQSPCGVNGCTASSCNDQMVIGVDDPSKIISNPIYYIVIGDTLIIDDFLNNDLNAASGSCLEIVENGGNGFLQASFTNFLNTKIMLTGVTNQNQKEIILKYIPVDALGNKGNNTSILIKPIPPLITCNTESICNLVYCAGGFETIQEQYIRPFSSQHSPDLYSNDPTLIYQHFDFPNPTEDFDCYLNQRSTDTALYPTTSPNKQFVGLVGSVEELFQPLISPILQGRKYEISFWGARYHGLNFLYNFNDPIIKVSLSKNAPCTQTDMACCDYSPIVIGFDTVDAPCGEWQRIKFCYTATDTLNFIMLWENQGGSYVFIDDIEVKDVTGYASNINVTATVNRTNVCVGDTIIYSFSISNNFSCGIATLNFTESLPVGITTLSNLSALSGKILLPGQNTIINIQVLVGSNVAHGTTLNACINLAVLGGCDTITVNNCAALKICPSFCIHSYTDTLGATDIVTTYANNLNFSNDTVLVLGDIVFDGNSVILNNNTVFYMQGTGNSYIHPTEHIKYIQGLSIPSSNLGIATTSGPNIFLKNSATLSLSDAAITANCDTMWGGIFMETGSNIIFTGTTDSSEISHSTIGIYINQTNNIFTNYQIERTRFLNNYLNFTIAGGNSSKASFIKNNRFYSHPQQMRAPYDSLNDYNKYYTWHVINYIVGNHTDALFENNSLTNCVYGVVSVDNGNMYIKNNTFNNVYREAMRFISTNSTAEGNVITYPEAASIPATAQMPSRPITVGVFINGFRNNSTYKVHNKVYGNRFLGVIPEHNIGVLAVFTDGFDIQRLNEFHDLDNAVYVEDIWSDSSNVFNNLFEGNTVGFFTSRMPSFVPNISIRCNTFDQGSHSFNSGIVISGDGYLNEQGHCLSPDGPTGNEFWFTTNWVSIENNNPNYTLTNKFKYNKYFNETVGTIAGVGFIDTIGCPINANPATCPDPVIGARIQPPLSKNVVMQFVQILIQNKIPQDKQKPIIPPVILFHERNKDMLQLENITRSMKQRNKFAYNHFAWNFVEHYMEQKDMTKAVQWKDEIMNANPNDIEVMNRSKYYDVWFKMQKLTVPQDYQLMQDDYNKLSEVANSGTSFARLACSMLHFYKPEMAEGCFSVINVTNKHSANSGGAKNSITDTIDDESDTPFLGDNYPNPFSDVTSIVYYLPEEFSGNAIINIYDVTGKKLKSCTLINGFGEIVINSSELKQGVYLYNLIANEEVIAFKKMIVIK